MASIDARYRKPRKTKGTTLFKFRYYVGGVVSVFTLVTGVILTYTPLFHGIFQSFELKSALRREILSETTEEERHRNNLMLSTFYNIIDDRAKAEKQKSSEPSI